VQGLAHWRRQTGYQSYSDMSRYTELSPTGSEISSTDRQSESVAAINGPTCCGLEAKKSMISRARGRVCQGEQALLSLKRLDRRNGL
jgi:hypothetical protein